MACDMVKNLSKKIFWERNFPYTFPIIWIILFIVLYQLNKKEWFIGGVDKTSISNLANTFITIVSIFISFVLVGLTLIYQTPSENIKMIKKNGLYNRLIGFFKTPLWVSLILIGLSILLSLGIWLNFYFYTIYMFFLFLMFFSGFRIFKYLFKILKE